jgi:hypothetical protein
MQRDEDGFNIANIYLELGFEIPDHKITKEYFLTNTLKPRILQKIGNNADLLPKELSLLTTWCFDPFIKIYNRHLDLLTTYPNYTTNEGDLPKSLLKQIQENTKNQMLSSNDLNQSKTPKTKNICNFVLTMIDGQRFYCSA